MHGTVRVRHIENDILKTSGLSGRPMYSSSCTIVWDCGHINNEVSHLSPEDVRGTVGQPVCAVEISVDEAEARKVHRSFQCWDAIRVSDQVRIVVINDRGAYQVDTRREVDRGRCSCRRGTISRRTPVSIADS